MTGRVTGKLTGGEVDRAGATGDGTGTDPVTGLTGDVDTCRGTPAAGTVI
jgi:hypothetical protein